MSIVSSLLLAIALCCAVVIGPQTRPWSWGPAMVALGLAVLAALPGFWRRGRGSSDFPWLALAALTAGWFAWRAWVSPVAELGHADQLLLCAAVGAFLVVRNISGDAVAERVLLWGLAVLLAASLVVVAKQVADPSYEPIFESRAAENSVTGFFAHYNYAANFLIATSLVLGAAGLLGNHTRATRAIWLILAVAGMAAVYFTKSRGGILGAAAGCGVLAIMSIILAKRRESRWFAPSLVAVPLIGIGVAAFLFFGWAQRSGGDTHKLLDNDIRLYLLGIAVSCISQHPFTGGGSRSFSWECNQFIDNRIQSTGGHRPEMVHNELMQAASDYGLLGASLLVMLLGSLLIAATLRIFFESRPPQIDSRDAWRAGGLAALTGILVQSCFSFLFHLIPGAILLGFAMALSSRAPNRTGAAARGSQVLFTIVALLCALTLLPAGWKGSRLTHILWPTYLGKSPPHSVETRLDALDEAIAVWPQSELLADRARIRHELVIALAVGPGFKEPAELAIEDYAEAGRLHRFDPSFPVNRANLLSMLGRDDEADAAFADAIKLQGGMELAFRAHFSHAKHQLQKSLRQEPDAALATLEAAAATIEAAAENMPYLFGDMHDPRLLIHESLGVAREQAGDLLGALDAYNFAASLRGGQRAHYRAAQVLGRSAVADWSARNPSKALAGFIEASRRAGMAGQELPQGVTPADRSEYLEYLRRSIAFLRSARVEPAE
jgi:O-antigen ligase/tetratricopeptide (TPR) repeat protein